MSKRIMALVCAIVMLALAGCQSQVPVQPSGDVSDNGAAGGGLTSSVPESSSSTPEQPEGELTELTALEFDYAQEFQNGYGFAIRGTTGGYVDIDGRFIECYTLPQDTVDYFLGVWAEGCSDTLQVSPEGIYPAYDEAEDKWGYKNIKTGATVAAAKYDTPVPFVDGRAAVCYTQISSDGVNASAHTNYEVIDTEGNVVFTPGTVFGTYQDGLLPAVYGDYSIGYLDVDGNVVIPDISEGMGGGPTVYGYWAASGFQPPKENGCFTVWGGGSTRGYYDNKGNVLRDFGDAPQFYFPQNGFVAYRDEATGLFGLETMDGSAKLTEAMYADVGFFYAGACWVKNEEGLYGLVDETGALTIPCRYAGVGRPNEGYLAVQDAQNQKWGVVTFTGEPVLECAYDYLSFVFGEKCVYQESGSYGYMDLTGRKLTDARYAKCWTEEEGTLLVAAGSKTVGEYGGTMPEKYGYLKVN